MTFEKNKKWAVLAAVLALVIAGGFFAFGGDESEPVADAASAPAAGGDTANVAGKTGLAAYDTNGDGIVYQAGMHPHIVRDEPGQCPICGMDLMPVRIDGMEEGAVRIDPATLQNIGVRTATVGVEALGRTVRTTGRFEANERGLVAVSPKVGGWVEKLHVDYEGARVRRGQPLLEIYSPELVSTQEEYLLAVRHAERMSGSADAQRLVEAARRRLSFWDISDAQIEQLAATGTPRKTLTLYAPASGTVSLKRVVEGQQIMPGQTLMQLADLSRLWLMVDVFEQDLSWVRVGTEARIELPYEPGRTLAGRIDYIYDDLDPEARTAKARITVTNPGLRLKPGMYATVHLVGDYTQPLPVVPEEALIRSGTDEAVILALGEGRFRPQPVTSGVHADGRVQILAGLRGGEQVVTSAQFLIDSEARLQSALGSMMAGTEPVGAVNDTPGVVRIHIGATGFEPKQVTVQAGVSTRFVFTRTSESSCATEVQSPALGLAATELPLGEPVAVELTPAKAGTYTFACGMDMLKGSIVVTPAG